MYLQNNTYLQGNKYQIVRHISSGGFGNTYEGVHTMLDSHIAIKEFFVKDFCNRDDNSSNVTVGTQSKVGLVQKLRRKFVEEAKSIYKMQHRNIVRVLDIFEENGTAYYVMDYIEGLSLQDIVKQRGELPEKDVLRYIIQVADALKYVHSQNRLHLDIKPGNIMVDKDENVKLIDFGASKQYDEEAGENTSTLLGRTPGYAPIEQMGNTIRTFSPATDIYALGATMYKCLTGKTPPDATLIMEDGLEPLPSVISEKTRKAIEKAMQVIKKNRPQSIDEFLMLLYDNSCSEPIPNDNPPVINIDKEEDTQLCTEIIEPSIDYNEVVDLGLSVKWCKYNLGAKKVNDLGRYYCWGDVSGNRMEVDLNSYPSSNPPSDICGRPEYDMAMFTKGARWRLPTKEEQDELRLNCRWEWKLIDGIYGYKVIGKNGNHIFLPAAGYREEFDYKNQDNKGFYWSGNLHKSNKDTADYLFFDENDQRWMNASRHYGFSVRPVLNQ